MATVKPGDPVIGTPATNNQVRYGDLIMGVDANGDAAFIRLDENGNTLNISSASTKITYIDEPDSSTTYIGLAEPGSSTSSAVWQIKKILLSGNITSILYADGNIEFDNIWDNRASLTYT